MLLSQSSQLGRVIFLGVRTSTNVRKARSASQRRAWQEGQKTRLSIVNFNTSVFMATGVPTSDFEKAVAVFGMRLVTVFRC
jgi:hypothetical protein